MRFQSRFVASLAAVAMSALLSTAALADDAFKIDSVHSNVSFKIKHMNVSYVYGRFDDISGSFLLNGDNSMFDITVDTKSVDTKNSKRDDHIKGPDFFDAKQFPTITFKSKEVKVDGDKLDVTGDLTLHGVTKSIKVMMEKVGEGPSMPPGHTLAGVEGSFTIKRSDFGMDKMVGPVGDDVTLTIAFEGSK